MVYDYLTEYMNLKESNIVVMGKSLGTGPATHIAAHRNPRALILVTPFISIRECVIDIIGSFCKYLMTDKFRNIDKIR